jgi:hypothetical protein
MTDSVKVKKEDIDAFLALMVIGGTAPSVSNSGYIRNYRERHDIPYLNLDKHKEIQIQKEITYFKPRVKYNVSGRSRDLYKKWPMVAQGYLHWYGLQGLLVMEGDKYRVSSDTGWAIYKASRFQSSAVFECVEYSGTIK